MHAELQVLSTRHCGDIMCTACHMPLPGISYCNHPHVPTAGCLHASLMSSLISVGARDVRGIPQSRREGGREGGGGGSMK